MERAARSLAKLKLSDKVSPEELAHAAWVAAVGERLAERARPGALVRGKLIVEAEDSVWQQQLFFLRSQILDKIEKVVGKGLITDLEFRIAARRRPAQMASNLDSKPRLEDEADAIADPALRIIYKQARKKAAG
jgi:predicted nucleic acid-binding Zn ribbon protein